MKAPEEHIKFLQKNKGTFKLKVLNHYRIPKEYKEILHNYGFWLEALIEGKIQPCSKAQKRFISVFKEGKNPITKFEYAWEAYINEKEYDESIIEGVSFVYDQKKQWFDDSAHWRNKQIKKKQ